MSVFTTVTEQQLKVWLKDYSLGDLISLQGIASGIENTNYFVTTSHGRFVLTLFEKLTANELPFYLNLMAHLSRHGIPCPSPVANRHEQYLGELNGKPACIVSRLNGKSTTSPNITQCRAMGAMLAELHLAGQSFSQQMPNPRSKQWRSTTALQVQPFLNTEQLSLLMSEVELQQQQDWSQLPQGIIHADLFRDNALMEEEQVGGIIDFYFACSDVLLYDIAITLNDWCMTTEHQLDQESAQAFLQAYHQKRPLQENEQQAWYMVLRCAALRFWLSRLFDLHLPRDGEMVHAHDPKHFEHILRNHIKNQQPVWINS